ncbi:MAG TPA: zf-TFIIB domain-containing protein [Terracidiphilus sp.]|nr:zf-TFIIB domain-containing protein [Terracidiphilus sp.]
MNCPACGAPITPKPDTEGFKCDYCHAVFYPGEEDDGVVLSAEPGDSSQACPVCSVPLINASLAKTPLLYCSQCHGLMLPMPVLQSLIDAMRAGREKPAVQTPPDRGDLKRAIQCPRCHRRMENHFYAGPGNVIIDSCSDCLLIWLDRGELTRIAHAPDESDSEDSGDSSWS